MRESSVQTLERVHVYITTIFEGVENAIAIHSQDSNAHQELD